MMTPPKPVGRGARGCPIFGNMPSAAHTGCFDVVTCSHGMTPIYADFLAVLLQDEKLIMLLLP